MHSSGGGHCGSHVPFMMTSDSAEGVMVTAVGALGMGVAGGGGGDTRRAHSSSVRMAATTPATAAAAVV